MSPVAIALIAGITIAPAHAEEEPIELVRARYAQQLAAGFIPVDLQEHAAPWDPEDPDLRDEDGRPFAGVAYTAGKADLVLNVQASSQVKGVTPVIFVQDPSGEPAQLGDLSPNAGEADAWLRLHAPGEWLVIALADTPKTQGQVTLELVIYDTSGVGAPAALGTMLQTEAGAAQAASSGGGSDSSEIITSELDPSDPTTDGGAYYEVFGFPLSDGERIRIAALSDHYDLVMLLDPPGDEAITAESNGLAGTPALLDYTAKASGEASLALFAKDGNPTGAYEFMAVNELSGDLCRQLAPYEVADAWQLPGIEDARTPSQMRKRTLVDTMAFAQTCSVDSFGADLGVACRLPAADQAAAKAIFEPLAAEFRSCNAGWEISEHPSGDDLSIYAVKDGRTRTLTISNNVMTGWSVRAGTYTSK